MKISEEVVREYDEWLDSMSGCTMLEHGGLEGFAMGCESAEYYKGLAKNADPKCNKCHGDGYLPIISYDGLAKSCDCVSRRSHIIVGDQ